MSNDRPDVGDWTTPTLTVDPYDAGTVATLTVATPAGATTAMTATTGDGGHTWTTAAVQYTAPGWWVLTWTVAGTGAGVEAQQVYVAATPTGGTTPLFTAAEFALYLGSSVSDERYALAHTFVLDAFEGVVGEGVITDPPQKGLRSLALEVAKRIFLNPLGLRERGIDDYREVYASETLTGAGLTVGEIDRLRRAVGTVSGAFTIRPSGPGVSRYPSEAAYVLTRSYPWTA